MVNRAHHKPAADWKSLAAPNMTQTEHDDINPSSKTQQGTIKTYNYLHCCRVRFVWASSRRKCRRNGQRHQMSIHTEDILQHNAPVGRVRGLMVALLEQLARLRQLVETSPHLQLLELESAAEQGHSNAFFE